MVYSLYTIVILAATSLGAVAGLGGGVIIKPLLDALGYHDATTIGIYSSMAVFTMCVVSLARQARAGFDFDRRVALWVSVGSLVGGLVGERVFCAATAALSDASVKSMQAGMLACTLLVILVYTLRQDAMPSFNVRSSAVITGVGMALGAVSVFLGIGGGPLNVAAFTLFFGMDLKQATVYSLTTIFFSQLSKLADNAATGSLWAVDLACVPAVVLSAVVGGLVGTAINRRVCERVVRTTYVCIMVALLALSLIRSGLIPFQHV